jgi:hypothetical protein
MRDDRPRYDVYSYFGDSLISQFLHFVDERRDAEIIEHVREFRAETHEPGLRDHLSYTDVFYWHETEVTLVGTWVRNDDEDIWHPGGWIDRPQASRENGLRFLRELGRPV